MITDIHLQSFRSYKDESFEFSPHVNIIVGPNASGKTNLIESILFVSRGSSFRAKDNELVGFNNEWSRLEANTDNSNRIAKIQRLELDPGKSLKTFEINSNKIKRLNLNQTIPIVLFEPNHLLLLIGSPELRRSFLDDILEQTVTGFKTLKNHYKRALAQRNNLLKRNDLKNTEIFVWNVRISELGGKIFKQRAQLLKKIQSEVNNIYKSLSKGNETIEVLYQTNLRQDNYDSDLLKKLETNIETDMVRGFTSFGPHRDDVKFLINNKNANKVASRGETRTILLSLKIVEATIVEDMRDLKPILLFDDVFSELDGARRLSLVKILNQYQTFITTTDADVVIQHFTKAANIILVEKN